MKLPTLYKKDNKGKIREWDVEVVVEQGYPRILVTHGEQNGKKQEKHTLVANGKNIGKSNETSAFDQAVSEAKSKWEKQLDKGYGETLRDVFRPMLAQSYKDHSKKILFPCYIQPKLDGLRSTISLEDGRVVARSRNGKEWKTLDHITSELESVFKHDDNLILDGELFTRETNFQNIISGIKRDEPNQYTPMIQFWCYDMFHKSLTQQKFANRYDYLQNLLIKMFPAKGVVLVETNLVEDSFELDALYDQYVADGYEGAMARNAHGIYEPKKRSYHLQKVKSFIDAEFVIIDKRLDKNGECVFTCQTNSGKSFDVKPEGSHEIREQYFYDDNIGELLTVKFFEWTNDEVPRFPVGLRVRESVE